MLSHRNRTETRNQEKQTCRFGHGTLEGKSEGGRRAVKRHGERAVGRM